LYQLSGADFHDVTTGNSGYAASPGYDLVTGRGSPLVNLVVDDLAAAVLSGPIVGSFAAVPASVTAGSLVTFTASNVAEAGGAISGVSFYRESNGVASLQTGADTFVGAGTQSGSDWTLTIDTTGMAAGNYLYYAVATDAVNQSGNPYAATL